MSAPTPQRFIKIKTVGDVTQVSFVSSRLLGEENVRATFEPIHNLVVEEGVQKLLLNFLNVEYLSSMALGRLVLLHKEIQASGGQLILCNLNPNLVEVFRLGNLDRTFNLKKDEEDAMGAFGVPVDQRGKE